MLPTTLFTLPLLAALSSVLVPSDAKAIWRAKERRAADTPVAQQAVTLEEVAVVTVNSHQRREAQVLPVVSTALPVLSSPSPSVTLVTVITSVIFQTDVITVTSCPPEQPQCPSLQLAIVPSVTTLSCFDDYRQSFLTSYGPTATTLCSSINAVPTTQLALLAPEYADILDDVVLGQAVAGAGARSACSCYLNKAAAATGPSATTCLADDPLKALQSNAVNAIPFCSSFLGGNPPTALPPYISAFATPSISSACSCLSRTVEVPISVLPTTCFQDDVLRAIQTFSADAITFCPNLLASPGIPLPTYVSQYGPTSASSACSCFLGGGAGIGPVVTPTPTAIITPPLPPSTQCFQDDLLNALERNAFLNPGEAISFCSGISVGPAPASTPVYLATFNAAQVTSGCSCFYKTVLNPVTVLPTQCNLDDVLLNLQFNPAIATTFCPTFLATPTGPVPDIVRPYGTPSILSACSCYQSTAGGVLTTPTPTAVLPPSTQCFEDDVLRVIARHAFLNPGVAQSFCSALSVGPSPTSTPAFLTTFAAAQVSSGCSCFYKTVLNPVTVLPTQCNLDDVLLNLQFNPAIATTFCPSFLATPTGPVPDIVRPYGTPSILSACSCYQSTAGGVITPTPTAVLPPSTQCFEDDVLRVIARDAFLNPGVAQSFCSALSVGPSPTSTPAFLTTFAAAQVSSGCSCFYKTVLNPVTVLPEQCNLDDVLLNLQFNPAIATTFCPTFLATPTAGVIPEIVRPFGLPSIISACSCYQRTAGPTLPTSTPIAPLTTTDLPLPTQCFPDDVLNAINRNAFLNPQEAISYCSAISVGPAPTSTPVFLTAFNAAQVSSGCSCFYRTVLNPVTVLPEQCNLDDVLLALQFNQPIASTFCPTFLATPTAGTIPDIVRPFGIPSIVSACSCYQRTAGPTLPTSTPIAPVTTTDLPLPTQCFQDDVLNAINRNAFLNPQEAISYCSALSVGVAPTTTPAYLATFNGAQVSSGCSCFYKTVLNPVTVLPEQCNLDDVLLNLQFNPAIATTFCPTFLATPTAGTIPDIVRPYGIPSIISACSCYQRTAGGTSATSTSSAIITPTTPSSIPAITTPATTVATACNQDDALRALENNAVLAIPFCAQYLLDLGAPVLGIPVAVPNFVATFAPTSIRSACSCFQATVISPVTVLPTQCNLDDVLLALSFNAPDASTFCPNFLATSTVAIPSYVTRFGTPSIRSACSCFQTSASTPTTIGPLTSITPITSPTGLVTPPTAPVTTPATGTTIPGVSTGPIATTCLADDVLKALQTNAVAAIPFCLTFLAPLGPLALPVPLPTFVSQFESVSVSSACSCLSRTVVSPVTALPTTCFDDDVLRAVQTFSAQAITDCPSFLASPNVPVPTYVSQYGALSASSACSCFLTTTSAGPPPLIPTLLPSLPTSILPSLPTSILPSLPTEILTSLPTEILTSLPTEILTSILPSLPTEILTSLPTDILTSLPTEILTSLPLTTILPSSVLPTDPATLLPSILSSILPSELTSLIPSLVSSILPSLIPTDVVTDLPTSVLPTDVLPTLPLTTILPTSVLPTDPATLLPSILSSLLPSELTSLIPSLVSSILPSLVPTDLPTSILPTDVVPSLPTSILPSLPTDIVTSLPTSILPSLPTSILSVLSSLLPSELTSLLPSLPTDIVTSLPTDVVPSLPTSILPSLPTDVISLPTSALPSLPTSLLSVLSSLLPSELTSLLPTLPTEVVPSLPTSILPSLPTSILPSLPTDIVSLPTSLVPSLPTSVLPTLPTDIISLPTSVLPSLPTSILSVLSSLLPSELTSLLPSLPTSVLPSLPTSILPSLPTSILPSLPTDIVSLPTSLIPSLPTSILPSLPTSILPSLPTSILPSLPTSILPSLPTSILPSLPTSLLPSLPTSILPSLPTSILPSLPTDLLPSLPTTLLPSLPTSILPSLPTSILPSLPTSLLPSLPTSILPSLPTTLLPSLPTSILPSLPTSILPSLPTNVLPSLPTSILPSLPTSILPSLPSLPTSILPSLPTTLLPSLPTSLLPSLPTSILPSLPTSLLPSLPTSILPSLPTSILPTLPPIGPSSSTTTATSAATCLADDVLRAVEFNAANAIPFCQSFLVATRTVSLTVPTYLTQFATPSISSACSCLQRTVISPVTVLPTTCFQDDVLRAVQTFSADAITFCPSFLAAPSAATSIPSYVSRFGLPSISSACSCFQAVLTASVSPITPVTPLPTACITDDALRALDRFNIEASPFCSSYLTAASGAVPIPSFLTSFIPPSISSACSCFGRSTSVSATTTPTSTSASIAASCIQDTVLQALETFSAQAADFCPSLLAAPLEATVTAPFFVTAFPTPSVRSACSCFVATTRSSLTVPTSSTLVSSSLSTTIVTSITSTTTSSSATSTVSLICFEDGPLLALEAVRAQAGPFCTSFLTAGGPLPTFVAQFQPNEVSSACTCFGLRTGLQSTFTPVSTSSSPSSSAAVSTTSSSITTSVVSSTSTSSSTTSSILSTSSSVVVSSSSTSSSTAVTSSTNPVSSSSSSSVTTSSAPGSTSSSSSTFSSSSSSSSSAVSSSASSSSSSSSTTSLIIGPPTFLSSSTSATSSPSTSAPSSTASTSTLTTTSSASASGSSVASSSSSSSVPGSSSTSSFSTTGTSTTSSSSAVTPTVSVICFEDAVLLTLINDRAQADAFCPTFMMSGGVIAPFVAQFPPAQVSSACSCYGDRFGLQTTMSSTGTTSSGAASSSSALTTTGSSTGVVSSSSSPSSSSSSVSGSSSTGTATTGTASTSTPTSTAATNTSTGTGTGTASTSSPTSTAATSTGTTSTSTRNTYSTSRTVTTVIGDLTTVTVEPSVCIRRRRVRAVRKVKKA
ncbi:MAG: hypothetical protein M1823_001308 [Watsoniomyces obsoletus]|nr:MAG: hypothetical protein M1823_001308 [Watsoniomyces obsoletus]